MMATVKTSERDTAGEIAYLTRALKAPSLRDAAERARTEAWTHQEYLAACLQREVTARDAHGGEGRIRAARFPARKSLEEFDFDHARGLKRDLISHLGTLDLVTARENVVFLGPPGTGKTTSPPGWRSAPAKPATGSCSTPPALGRPARHRPPHRPAPRRTDQAGPILAPGRRRGRLHPLGPEAANLFFQLVSNRYVRASLIVTSNKPFGR